MTLHEGSERLAADAHCDIEQARGALKKFLIACQQLKTQEGRQPFAFKLHQFTSGPGNVHTTLEAPDERPVTLEAQRFALGKQGCSTPPTSVASVARNTCR